MKAQKESYELQIAGLRQQVVGRDYCIVYLYTVRVHSLNNVPYQPINLENRRVLEAFLRYNRPKLDKAAQIAESRLAQSPESPEHLGCVPGSEHDLKSALVRVPSCSSNVPVHHGPPLLLRTILLLVEYPYRLTLRHFS